MRLKQKKMLECKEHYEKNYVYINALRVRVAGKHLYGLFFKILCVRSALQRLEARVVFLENTLLCFYVFSFAQIVETMREAM